MVDVETKVKTFSEEVLLIKNKMQIVDKENSLLKNELKVAHNDVHNLRSKVNEMKTTLKETENVLHNETLESKILELQEFKQKKIIEEKKIKKKL